MNQFLKVCAVVVTGFLLVACGGGGGSPAPAAPPPLPSSYWTMDTYKYVRADSIQSSYQIGPIPDYTIVTVSTPTLTPSASANLGAYTDSAMAFRLIGTAPGTYTVVAADQLKEENRALNYIAVLADIGIGVTTGSSRYVGTSGTITVVKNNGVLYFTSATPIQMAKSLDVLGGVAGAPAIMTLNIVDAY